MDVLRETMMFDHYNFSRRVYQIMSDYGFTEAAAAYGEKPWLFVDKEILERQWEKYAKDYWAKKGRKV